MLSLKASQGRKNFAQAVLCLISIILFINSCKNKQQKWLDVDPAYAKYVEAYTTGIVSKTSTVRIQLAADAATTHTVGEPVKDNLFELSP